jgi:hypothetical protein
MARKVGQIIARGDRRWLIRVYLGRDHETKTRKYHNRTIHGSIRDAQAYLTRKLRERDLGHDLEGAKITLNEYLDRWLKTAVKPRVREKTCQDYDGMLRRYIRPSLGETVLATMQPMDVQTACQKMTERGHRRVASNSLGSSCGPLHTSILQESCRASSGITGCRSPGLYSPFSYP